METIAVPEWFLQIASETGPIITAIVVSYWHLNRRLQDVEKEVSHKLDNGLRSDLQNLRVEVAGIQGKFENCPSNSKNH
jgi:hypothetical protein